MGKFIMKRISHFRLRKEIPKLITESYYENSKSLVNKVFNNIIDHIANLAKTVLFYSQRMHPQFINQSQISEAQSTPGGNLQFENITECPQQW